MKRMIGPDTGRQSKAKLNKDQKRKTHWPNILNMNLEQTNKKAE